jgi:tetratricopeptide (TPR) repeat protein
MALIQRVFLLLVVLHLAACVSSGKKQDIAANEPFLLKELVPIYVSKSSDIVKVGTDTLIASYRDLLTRINDSELEAAITARVADLELLLQDQLVAEAEDNDKVYLPNYSKAIDAYNDIIRKFPELVNNDQIYYQLAKAYDLSAQGDQSLYALTQLVNKYPKSTYYVEAQFRRGDYLFSKGRYRDAQGAYQAAVDKGKATPFYENALYMNGWTAFKRNYYDPALDNFIGVLDRTMPKNGRIEGVEPTKLALVEDSLRIMGIVFAYMDGGKSIAQTFERLGPRAYDGLLYEQLGDLLVDQQRYKDAISTYKDFIALNPRNQYAPAMHNKVLRTMQLAKFYSQSFAEKESFIDTYGMSGDYYAQADDITRDYVKPYLYAYIDEVARFYHSRAQKAKKESSAKQAEMQKDYASAIRFYEKFVENFPDDSNTPEKVFMMAEIYADTEDYEQAIKNYESAAYEYPINFYSEDAVFASILAYGKLVKAELNEDARSVLVRRKLAAQLKLTEQYAFSKHSQPVMLDAIDTLYQEKDYEQVIVYTQRFLALTPSPEQKQQADVSIVLGHSHFELKNYAAAEESYQSALALLDAQDSRREDLIDRIAASIYRKAETLYAENNKEQAIDEFLRISQVAPSSQYRKNAEYDAATYLLEIESWTRAVDVLTAYRSRFDPEQNSLEVSAKFLAGYEGMKRFDLAATELTRVSALSDDPDKKRQALFLSAEYYEKSGQETKSLSMYQEYLQLYPEPFDLAMETRFKMSEAYKRLNDKNAYRYWLEEMIRYDLSAGDDRTDRSKYLAASAKNVFADENRQVFESIKLTLPLNESLPRKRDALDIALNAYQEILDYGVQEFTTQATYYVGRIYGQLSRDLINSDRPPGLDELAMEQYGILLEEEAYPFEEKAIEIHEANVLNSTSGNFDKWVSKSIDALAKLQPGRYNKKEEQGGYSNAIY